LLEFPIAHPEQTDEKSGSGQWLLADEVGTVQKNENLHS